MQGARPQDSPWFACQGNATTQRAAYRLAQREPPQYAKTALQSLARAVDHSLRTAHVVHDIATYWRLQLERVSSLEAA
jgi:hypothetical protein